MTTTVLKFLLLHWKASAIVALVLTLAGTTAALWVKRDQALVARGQAIERARVADSTLKATAAPIARVDTLVIRETQTVPRLIARVDSLRDTLRITDTVQVKEYVTRTDSALRACSELAGDCAEFRRLANQRFAAYEAKLAALVPALPPPRHCGIAIAGGFAVARDGTGIHAGPGASLGVGCRF